MGRGDGNNGRICGVPVVVKSDSSSRGWLWLGEQRPVQDAICLEPRLEQVISYRDCDGIFPSPVGFGDPVVEPLNH